jgi:hypothetical protein
MLNRETGPRPWGIVYIVALLVAVALAWAWLRPTFP